MYFLPHSSCMHCLGADILGNPPCPPPVFFFKKHIGRYNLQQILQGLEAFTLRLYTQTLGWDTEEVAILLAKVRKDLTNPQIHVHFFL